MLFWLSLQAFSKGRTLDCVDPTSIRWDLSAAPPSTAASVVSSTSLIHEISSTTGTSIQSTSLHPLAPMSTTYRAMPSSSSSSSATAAAVSEVIGISSATSTSGTGSSAALPMSPVERLSIPDSAWAAIASAVAQHRTPSTTSK